MTTIAVIESDRLRLEPITMEHVELLVELDSDPEVMRYLTGGAATPRDEVAATVRASLGQRWIARAAASGRFVGWIGLRRSAADEAELGYRLRRSAWGRGYGSEGSQAVIDFGFERWGLRRIWAQTMTVNTPSRRVMEACGLRYVRTFHLDWPDPIEGTEQGDVEYEILRPEGPTGSS